MKRRDFLATSAAAALGTPIVANHAWARHLHEDAKQCGMMYASPMEAMKAPREKVAFVTCTYNGTNRDSSDYLAVVDVDPSSSTYGQVLERVFMPTPGDELHHFGWNACSSCHGDPTKSRRYLIVPGLVSGRIHVIDVADPRVPKMHKVIEGAEIAQKVNLSTPHTVHCLADGKVMISMLGDAAGQGPGGFLLLDENFDIAGRWETGTDGMNFNYDFWYQPRHNVMISSEWAAPNTVAPGFDLEDVKAGKYGHHIHFWDWTAGKIAQSIDLGETGLIPLEVRFHHDPDSTHGFVGAALSSTMWHWHHSDGRWQADKVIEVTPVEVEGWPIPVPGLITDLVLSLDDRWLYFSNWLHGDIRQYDVSDPANPRLAGRLWCGGVIGKKPSIEREFVGGPQMLQLSLDGKRLYLTSSLYSSWDNQFYPEMRDAGSFMLQIDCDTENGGMTINEDFYVDFGKEPKGPVRAHEIRFPDGDCTSDIWL